MRQDQDAREQEGTYPNLHLWHNEVADYSVAINGEREPSRFWVQAAVPVESGERPKLILEEHAENMGRSLDDDALKADVITRISGEMSYQANDIDWFYRDDNGQVQAVDLTYEQERREHPTFTELRQSGDLNRDDLDEARARFFPDQTVNVFTAETVEPSVEKLEELDAAFHGRTNDTLNDARSRQGDEGQGVYEPDIDLSKESFTPRSEVFQPEQPTQDANENEIQRDGR